MRGHPSLRPSSIWDHIKNKQVKLAHCKIPPYSAKLLILFIFYSSFTVIVFFYCNFHICFFWAFICFILCSISVGLLCCLLYFPQCSLSHQFLCSLTTHFLLLPIANNKPHLYLSHTEEDWSLSQNIYQIVVSQIFHWFVFILYYYYWNAKLMQMWTLCFILSLNQQFKNCSFHFC